MKKILTFFIVLCIVFAFAACGTTSLQEPSPAPAPPATADPVLPPASPAPEQPEPTEAPAAEPRDIVVLFTSDVHCAIDQGFSYAGLQTVRDTLALKNDVILVDNGDAVQGEPIGTLTSGEAIIDLMNTIGYDVAIPGNHEFDYGMDQFFALTERAEYPYVSSNFNKDGDLVFAPYEILERGGKKLAFVGVTTPKTLTSSTPKYFMDENGNFSYGFMQDESGEKLYRAVQSAVDCARAEGADYVIVLAHLGYSEGADPYNYAALISNVTGIDAVLDGHTHDTEQVCMTDDSGKTVLRSACGSRLGGIGWLRISAEDGSLDAGVYAWDNDISAAELFGIENEMSDAVNALSDTLNQKLNEVVAASEVTLTINDPEAEDDAGQPIRIIRRAETNLGDFCADAFRDQSGADVAFANGGGIRVSIPAGEITLGDILSVHPFGNALCVMEVSGLQILDALEWGARAVPDESGAFLQVSGLSYEIHTYIPSSCTQDENGMFTGVAGEYRVTNVKVGSEDLDLSGTYTLASHNYMLKSKGDGFSMFDGCKLLQDEVKLDNQVLIDYMVDTLGGVVGEEYAYPYGDGRIIAVEEP